MRIHRHGLPVIVSAFLVAVAVSAWGQGEMKSMGGSQPATMKAPAPIRTTMEALHASGGVPKGWKFLLPPGNAADGRKVFVTMECFSCHEVKGEKFPDTSKTPREVGPDLTGMGMHHPAEYFAESVLNPNRVILMGSGYTGPDGLSKMPSYADTMTLRQLVDLVAYLKSLAGGEMHHHMSESPNADQTPHHSMGGSTTKSNEMKGGMKMDGK
jgi:mono/diheme cytochrome c family protein